MQKSKKDFAFDEVEFDKEEKLVRIWLDDSADYYFLRKQISEIFATRGVKPSTFTVKCSDYKGPTLTDEQRLKLQVAFELPPLGQGKLLHYADVQTLVEHFFQGPKKAQAREDLQFLFLEASPICSIFSPPAKPEPKTSTKKSSTPVAMEVTFQIPSPTLPISPNAVIDTREPDILKYLLEICDLELADQKKLFAQKFPGEKWEDWDGQLINSHSNVSSANATDDEDWQEFADAQGDNPESAHITDWDENNCLCPLCKDAKVYSFTAKLKGK